MGSRLRIRMAMGDNAGPQLAVGLDGTADDFPRQRIILRLIKPS